MKRIVLFIITILALFLFSSVVAFSYPTDEVTHQDNVDNFAINDRLAPCSVFIDWARFYAPVLYFREQWVNVFPGKVDYYENRFVYYVNAGWKDGYYNFSYWFYYPTDEKKLLNIPLAIPYISHNHDWEHIVVKVPGLDGLGKKPEKVEYHAHQSRHSVKFWEVEEKGYQGDGYPPRVKIINEGHGSYPPNLEASHPYWGGKAQLDLANSDYLHDDAYRYRRVDFTLVKMVFPIAVIYNSQKEINDITHYKWIVTETELGHSLANSYFYPWFYVFLPESLEGFTDPTGKQYKMPWQYNDWVFYAGDL